VRSPPEERTYITGIATELILYYIPLNLALPTFIHRDARITQKNLGKSVTHTHLGGVVAHTSRQRILPMGPLIAATSALFTY
jgi:hypothetical protein